MSLKKDLYNDFMELYENDLLRPVKQELMFRQEEVKDCKEFNRTLVARNKVDKERYEFLHEANMTAFFEKIEENKKYIKKRENMVPGDFYSNDEEDVVQLLAVGKKLCIFYNENKQTEETTAIGNFVNNHHLPLFFTKEQQAEISRSIQ